MILSIMLQCLTATATEQIVPCRLTCNNADYVKPGGQMATDRKLQAMGEKTGKIMKDAYDLMQPDNPKTMPNPKKALSRLNKLDFNELNPREKYFAYKLQGFCYISFKDYAKAIESYSRILYAKSGMSGEEEMQNLYMLGMLNNMNGNYAAALNHLLEWARLSNKIESKDYRNFSTIYNSLGDLPLAIANQARAIEVADNTTTPPVADYIQLKKLYDANKQIAESNKIQSILDSIPGADKFDKGPVPIIKVAYEYPAAAAARRIEGDCIVTFDVTPTGSTENAHVKDGDCTTITGQSTDIFIRASIKAAQQFKYAPKIENGKAVYVRNVSNKFSYRIAK